jgi:proline iminopeptidase
MVLRIGPAYASRPSLLATARELASGEWRMKTRAEAHIYAGRELLPGWSVMGRLGEIKVPTLVMAGRDDFVFPPEHQAQLAAGIPGAQLRIIDDAGHNPQSEQPDETMAVVRAFLRGELSGADESREAVLAGVHG